MSGADQNELKQLQFVPQYGGKGVEMATGAYETAKTYVPEPLKERLVKVEESLGAATAPYVTKAQDTGNQLLKTVDTKVDQAIQRAHTVYQSNSAYIQEQLEKQRQYHLQNLEAYRAAREQYLKKVEEAVEFLKTKGVTGTAKVAAEEVSAALSEARKIPGTVAKRVHDAFEKLMAMEPVQKVLKNTQPAVQAAYSRYQSVHDSVVASSSYKKLYDMSLTTLDQVQKSFIYRKAAENFYPFVAKYADPAVDQLLKSPQYQALLTHVAPKQQVAAM